MNPEMPIQPIPKIPTPLPISEAPIPPSVLERIPVFAEEQGEFQGKIDQSPISHTDADLEAAREAQRVSDLKAAWSKLTEDKGVPTESMDYYDRLGISRDSTEQEIKGAYKELAKIHHPDRNPGNKEAEIAFQFLTEANETLSDPKRRSSYDNGLIKTKAVKMEDVLNSVNQETAAALSKLQSTWLKFGHSIPGISYYQKLAREMPSNIEKEMKAIELFISISETWDLFMRESGVDVAIREGYFDSLLKKNSLSLVQFEIDKINYLRKLNSILITRRLDDKNRHIVLLDFVNNWGNQVKFQQLAFALRP